MQAQNGITSNPAWQIKPVINSGFIIVQRITIGHLVMGFPTNYELNISKPTLGNKLWQLENNKPDLGITLQCMDYKNPSQLGYGLTAAPYIEIPLNEQPKASRMILRLCWGVTYITKVFDIKTNHKNIAIGSHVNAFVQFRWFWHLQLTKKLRFEPGISFTHASNGKSRNPNLGLNVMSLNAGINYFIPSPTKIEVSRIDSSTSVKSKNEYVVFGAIGYNQRNKGTKTLQCYVLSGAYQRNLRNTHKFSVGLDLLYDQNYQIDYEKQFLAPATGINQLRMSARLGYSYNVGRISFPIEVGYYFFQRTNPDGAIVSRLGVRYYTRSGLIAHFGLRTHFAVAYNFEYGLGYRFFIK
ncbi:MAG: acyloxyacyl hydrolase [Bacteroidia bacterium]|nr:acyloxyacyl hydrolase [Bacteroidia bacterium]